MFINIWKMVFKSFGIQMGAIEPDVIISPNFQLIVNSPCYNIPGGKRSPAVISFVMSIPLSRQCS